MLNGDLYAAADGYDEATVAVPRPDLGKNVTMWTYSQMPESVPDPESTILVVDSRGDGIISPLAFKEANPIASRLPAGDGTIITHGGKRSNYLFHDGHVGSLRAVETYSPVNLWDFRPIAERKRYTPAELAAIVGSFAPQYR